MIPKSEDMKLMKVDKEIEMKFTIGNYIDQAIFYCLIRPILEMIDYLRNINDKDNQQPSL